jgi:hypothetical protein
MGKLLTVCVSALLLGNAPAMASQFQFGMMIELGSNSASSWELGLGSSSGSITSTASLTPYFINNQFRLFQLDYNKASNTTTLRMYAGSRALGPTTSASYSPVGGASAPADNLWTLPASLFFLQSAPSSSNTRIELSGLALSGINGAINILNPLQQTSMIEQQNNGNGAGSITQSGDVRFFADPTGSWRLEGLIRIRAAGGTPAQNALIFGLGASSSAAPEPWTMATVGSGLLFVALFRRRQSSHKA